MVRESPTESTPESQQITLSWLGVWRGIRRLGPIAIFVIPFGVGFGVAALEQGMPVVQAITMSALVFSGAAQFASLDFWPHPIGLVSIALVMFAVNARHIVTGAALSPWLNQLPLRTRWAALVFLSDPNFADSHPALQSGEKDVGILLGGGLILWMNWVFGTALGALVGAKVGNLEAYGFDVVMVCFFAAAITGRPKNRSGIIPTIVGAAVAFLTLGWLPAGWNIIFAAVAGGLWGVLSYAK